MKFIYHAKTGSGVPQTGEIEARNQDIALDILLRNSLVVTSIKEASKGPLLSRKITLFEHINLKDIAILTRQLAVMVEAKVPLVRSLRSLERQDKKPLLKKKLATIAEDVEGGTQFSDALAKHPRAFSSLFVNVIKSGEVSGRLSESLLYLADHVEREHELRRKVSGAMIYPAFVLCAFILVGIGMIVWVFPRITGLLSSSGQQIPTITRILIGLSEGIRIWWWLGIISLILIGLVVYIWQKSRRGPYQLDALKIRLPIFGGLLRKIYLARFSENLSTLVAGGIPIVKALEVSGDVVGNRVYKNIIGDTIVEVRAGQGIGVTMAKSKEVPAMVSDMMQVGEESGKLEQVLQSTSGFYRREVDASVANLTQLLEPIIIIAMGVMVALLVAGVLIPIYQISAGGI